MDRVIADGFLAKTFFLLNLEAEKRITNHTEHRVLEIIWQSSNSFVLLSI